MKKIRKTSRTTQKRKADALWSAKIRERGSCQRCGSTNWLQAAHIISRRYGHTRHALNNGLCLCAGCHRWAHDFPTEFSRWVEEIKGKATMINLETIARLNTKPDYEAVISSLKEPQDPKKEEVEG